MDIHTGTFDNSVGKICEMHRNQVCDDKDNVCSYGLHFCSIGYLPHYASSDGTCRTMIVKINPRDVVSIPRDHNNSKGRCCRYEVVGEYTEDWRNKDVGSGFKSNLCGNDGGDYQWPDDEDDEEEGYQEDNDSSDEENDEYTEEHFSLYDSFFKRY